MNTAKTSGLISVDPVRSLAGHRSSGKNTTTSAILLAIGCLLGSCSTPAYDPPLIKVDGGYNIHLEGNRLDASKVNGALIDLIVIDLGPLAKATSQADTASFVNAVMNEDKYVVKATGIGDMTNPSLLFVATNDVLVFDATQQHTLVIDVHDPANTKAHPNLHGTLGCGSCQLMNMFKPIYTTCLTGGKGRCITCVSCEVVGR